jgi:hypothetical protein
MVQRNDLASFTHSLIIYARNIWQLADNKMWLCKKKNTNGDIAEQVSTSILDILTE